MAPQVAVAVEAQKNVSIGAAGRAVHLKRLADLIDANVDIIILIAGSATATLVSQTLTLGLIIAFVAQLIMALMLGGIVVAAA